MSFPITVTFRGTEPSKPVANYIRREASALEERCAELQICRVAIEAPRKRDVETNRYYVRISMAVPGDAIFVGRPSELDPGEQDLYAAIDGAFSEARRSLVEFGRRQRASRRFAEPKKSA